MSDENDEIWELYADDGAQALDAMEDALVALSDGTGETSAHVAALFRAVHTFKGNSRVLGLSVVEGRTHLAEDLIGMVRDDGVALSAEIIEVLMRAGDTFRSMLEETAATRQDVAADPSEGLAADLEALIAAAKPADEDARDDVPAQPAAGPGDAAAPPADTSAPDTSAPDTPSDMPAPARLQADPAYRQIFLDMADSTIADLAALLEQPGDDLAQVAETKLSSLAYAATQLGLDDWQAALKVPEALSAATLPAIIEALRGLHGQDGAADSDLAGTAAADTATASGDTDTDADAAFFSALPALFRHVSDIGMRMQGDSPAPDAERDALQRDIEALIAPREVPRVATAAATLRSARDTGAYRAAELQFYEELARLEQTLEPGAIAADVILPGTLLRTWCADHVFETLQALRSGLDSPRKPGRTGWFADFEALMQQVYHASRHYRAETAAQLTMALVDLFARMRLDRGTPDALLIQIARGFIDTMELVFDALGQGDTPDMDRIEQLFEEASNVCFVASGMATAKSIEQRLGLPPEFHRVLSPESVKAAQSAIDAGLNFYVVRADLNRDEALAQRFLEWITGDHVRMITNATVFEGDATLFDFLLATPLSQPRMAEELADADPGNRHLSLRLALHVAPDAAPADAAPDAPETPAAGAPAITLQMLEAIGEISAGQAMVDHMLDELGGTDLLHDIDIGLRNAGLPALDMRVRAILREHVERHGAALQKVAEAGAQISARLRELQEDGTAMRARPAEVLLAPLAAFVSAEAHRTGRDARLTFAGAEIVLDQLVIEDLRRIVKPVLAARLAGDGAPRRFHVTVSQQEDRAVLDITDDGAAQQTMPAGIAEIAGDLRKRQGVFRQVALPGGGLRHHIAVPLQMMVMDVMVVRRGETRYALPVSAIQRIHQSRDTVTISASAGHRVLRLEDGRTVPIRTLSQSAAPRPGDADDLYVIVQAGGAQIAVPVDELLGQQLVLRRPLRGLLAGLDDLAGTAILSGGEIGMVVAVGSLTNPQKPRRARPQPPDAAPAPHFA